MFKNVTYTDMQGNLNEISERVKATCLASQHTSIKYITCQNTEPASFNSVIDEQWHDWLSQLRDEYCVYIKRNFIDVYLCYCGLSFGRSLFSPWFPFLLVYCCPQTAHLGCPRRGGKEGRHVQEPLAWGSWNGAGMTTLEIQLSCRRVMPTDGGQGRVDDRPWEASGL